jgi:RNA polymerase sigma-70 factor (ECF subfamily)
MNYSESEVIDRVKRGDSNAFKILVETYQPLAYSIAYRMTRNHNETEDIVQDSFIRCWQSIGRFDKRV